MSLRYRDSSGNETIVSGLTPGGDIEAGAVATREGTYITTVNISDNSNLQPVITFDSPMPDANYDITIEAVANWPIKSGGLTIVPFHNGDKTANGFRLIIYNTTGADIPAGMVIYWKATKTYTVQHAAQNAEDIVNIKAAIPPTASSTNQLTPKKYVDDADTALDDRVSDLEDLVPTNASVTNQLATKAEIDNVYTKTEVDTKLDNKQDTLTFDNEPTAGSSNPVKSNGIKNALDAKQNEQLANPVTVGSDTYNTVNAALTGIGDMINSGLSLGLTFTSLTSNTDINNCTDTTFKIWGSANTATCASLVNGPSERQNGEMAIIWIPFGNVLYGAQLYFAGAGANTPQIFIRYRFNTTWTNWVKLH